MSPELLEKLMVIRQNIYRTQDNISAIKSALDPLARVSIQVSVITPKRRPTNFYIQLSDIRSELEKKLITLGEKIDALQKELESL